ncbi:M23 family metallopeptidase [Clostridium sp. DL1XJH146]
MRSYNNEYEDYYRNLVRGNANGNIKQDKNHSGTKIGRRLIQEFAGTLVLAAIVLGCRAIDTPQTVAFYNYSKELVGKNFDYEEFYSGVKRTDYGSVLTEKIEEILDVFNSNIFNEETIKERIDEKFKQPLDSEAELDKENDSLLYNLENSKPILASSNGVVKEINDLGNEMNTVIIDHGYGIETKYSNLKNIYVKEGNEVKTGTELGVAGEQGEKTTMKFEIFYMGQKRNLTSCLN